MRSNVLTGDTPFRRAYIRSVIDQVEVDDDEIRIWGRKGVLERLVAASGGSGPAGVPSFVRKWRARQRFEPVTSAFGGQYLQFARGCRSLRQPVEKPLIHDTLLAGLCLCLISFA